MQAVTVWVRRGGTWVFGVGKGVGLVVPVVSVAMEGGISEGMTAKQVTEQTTARHCGVARGQRHP